MTVATIKVERSGPAIRAALAEFAPDERPQFETDIRPGNEPCWYRV